MAKSEQPIDVARSTLGGALRNGPLRVPNYQREYSWKRERVRKLFDDFNSAMVKQQSSYFMGTIVLTPGDPPCVVDGQQRLATTCIFLAAVRDAFTSLGEAKEAKSIRDDFLFKYDRQERDDRPRLLMNTDDRMFMHQCVLDSPPRSTQLSKRLHSHHRIEEASRIAAERVQVILASAETVARQVDALNAWVEFIDKRAVVVLLTPPTAARAYQMFKTLNDRAQRTTQVDMIKNHLFEQSDDHVDEAQSKWSTMRSTIEGLDQQHREDPLLVYLHNVSIAFNGPIKSDDIFEVMEERIIGRTKSLTFLESLATHAGDYAAIVTPSHAKWGTYDRRVRVYVGNIAQEIKMTFIRPLMLAIASRFSPAETKLAFRALSSWVVRFLIAGGSRSGIAEKAIGETAHAISERIITTTAVMTARMRPVIPSDVKFHSAFCTRSIASARQVRFLLRELESQMRGGTTDALTQPVEDTAILSLEHILPKNPAATAGWQHFSADEKKQYRNRLGNMVLLDTKDNGAINDKSFRDKRPVIERSKNLLVTADVLNRTNPSSDWTINDINERQKFLADKALERWPIDAT